MTRSASCVTTVSISSNCLSEAISSAIADFDPIPSINTSFIKFMTWIQGYKPEWVQDKAKAEELVTDLSGQLVGKSIKTTFVGWYEPDDSWYQDLPIILIINGEQIEICWQKFDSLSITKNQINVNNCISYGERIPFRENALSSLNKAIGKRVLSVKLGMSSMEWGGIEIPLINSLVFELENGYLTIFNALDENGVSHEPVKV